MHAKSIGTLEAKTQLSSLLSEVEKGRSFFICRHGKPIAELRPVGRKQHVRKAGFARGTFTFIAPDFDAPLEDFKDYM